MKYFLIVLALFLSACGGAASNQNTAVSAPTAAATPAVSPTPAPTPSPDAELERQFAEIAKDAKGKVGVSAVVLETGENASLNASEKFVMQSVYKLPISMAVMQQVDAGKFKPDQEIEITPADFAPAGQRSLIRDNFRDGTRMPLWHVIEYAIAESDGTACDVLLRLLGGPAEAQKYVDSLGIKDLTIKNFERDFVKDYKTQYDNYSTPTAAVALLRELYTGVSLEKERAKLIMDFMNESKPGRDRLRGLLPETAYAAHKTGTSGTRNGITAATNDIGIIQLPNKKYLLIAVFVGDSKADMRTAESVIAKTAKAAWDRWGN